MTKIFKPLIGCIIEVYIDDFVVKSRTRSEHAQHLDEIFHLMRGYNMKLNPTKCVFGVNASKFLVFIVTQRGIEVNPNQIKAVMEASALSCNKKLQCLTGCLAAIERFIARFMDKLRHFFLTLKRANAIGWRSDYELAFEDIKRSHNHPF